MSVLSTCFLDKNYQPVGILYLTDNKENYIDFNSEQIVYEDESTLPSHSFDLISYLISNSPSPVKRDTILEKVWDDSFTDAKYTQSNNKQLTKCISALTKSSILNALISSTKSSNGMRNGTYAFHFPKEINIYYAKDKIKRNMMREDIPKFVKERNKGEVFVDSLESNSTNKSFTKASGFINELYKQYYKEKNPVSFTDFITKVLFKPISYKFDEDAIDNLKHYDLFTDDIVENDNNPFNEFSGTSDTLVEYFENELFHDFELERVKYCSDFFTVVINAFRSTYRDKDSLDELHAHRRISLDSAKRISKYIASEQKTAILTPKKFAALMYSILFFCANGYICRKYSAEVNILNKDKEEFDKEVIAKYGCSGKPAVYAILNLANRENPNSIAVFEAGELEYYGKGLSKTPNLEKAYSYYKKGYEDLEQFNPLCAWSYAYMLYSYKRKDLVDATVKELDAKSEKDRINEAIPPAIAAFEAGCPAAANILGQITRNMDDVKNIHKSSLNRTSLEYFEIASESGYVFAKNNLGEHYIKLAESTDDNQKKSEYYEKGYEYYKESADLGEPYACNKYAKNCCIKLFNDYDSAFPYFLKAYELYNEWAAWNLLESYLIPYYTNSNRRIYKYLNEAEIDELYANTKRICKNAENPSVRANYIDVFGDELEDIEDEEAENNEGIKE